MVTFLTIKQKYPSLLEQSDPCLPTLQEHSPTETSQFPAPLQSSGQVNSEINENKTFLYHRSEKEALKINFKLNHSKHIYIHTTNVLFVYQ